MNIPEALRRANPGMPLYSAEDPAFAPYGRLLSVPDGAALIRALSETPQPAEGNSYAASLPELESTAAARYLEKTVFGGMPSQAGCCNGHGFTQNALEYHKCSEVNASPDGLVLLLALPEQLKDGFLDSRDVKGFYLPPGVFAEIFPRVLHFAPCRIRPEGFRCLVVLERGVNEPLPAESLPALSGGAPPPAGEEKLLWMRGKWMTCHPDSPQAAKGAFPGIRGENLTLALPSPTPAKH